MKVQKNEYLMTDVESVYDVWRTELENLYYWPAINQDCISVEFYTNCMTCKAVLENIGNDCEDTSRHFLNQSFSENEIHKALSKLKLKKNPGSDKIPNEVLKQSGIKKTFQRNSYIFCSNNSIVPKLCLRQWLNRFPKGSDKDLHVF